MFKHSLLNMVAAVGLGASALMMSAPSAQAQEPTLGEIRYFGFNFCPRGWAYASGTLLPIASNQSLFSLLGTIYGGDGRTTFALPDLRGRAPVSYGTGNGLTARSIGARFGSEQRGLLPSNMPSHTHDINATNQPGTKHGPGNDFLATAAYQDGTNLNLYGEGPPNRTMDSGTIGSTGANQPFSVTGARLAMSVCIATQGLFPPRN